MILDPLVLATLIPIKGDLTQPSTDLWPTIVTIFRNAFVEGIAEGVERLPPPRATAPEKEDKKEEARTQARRSSSPRGELMRIQVSVLTRQAWLANRSLLFVAALAIAVAGCHARKVGRNPEKSSDKSEQTEEGKDNQKEGTSTLESPGQARSPRPKIRPEHTPLALSPDQLLMPGAVDEVQRALRAKGYGGNFTPGKLDEATAVALRRFQGDKDLARTGVPDRQTLRELGLDPNKLTRANAEKRSSEKQQKGER